MGKKLGIAAAICFAFALCFALVGCGGVNKAAYTGTWELESGSDENLDAESIALMKSLGLEVSMTLNEDGTGSLNLFGEMMNLTWEAKTNTEGIITFNETNAALKLSDGKLILEDSTGASMTFAKADNTASASASASSASEEAASSQAASSATASAASESAEAASTEDESAETASSEAAGSEGSAASDAASEEASSSAAAA